MRRAAWGTYAVQLAKAFGAVVTGVCSTSKAELVRDHRRRRGHRLHPRGLHRRHAPIRPDPRHRGTAALVATAPGPHAARHPRHRRRRRRRPLARRLSTPDLRPLRSLFTEQKLLGLISKERQQDLLTLKDLIEAGKLTPVIDRTYPLRRGPSGHTLPRARPRARQGRAHRLRIEEPYTPRCTTPRWSP